MNSRSRDSILPHLLVDSIRHQRAVLLLGAGASTECKDAMGQRPPDGLKLRDALAKKFLGTENEQRDLMTVAELAISSGAGEPAVFDEIESMFRGFPPSEAHKTIPKFNWRGLATTNYDLFIEEAYAKVRRKMQTCVPFAKDAEQYENRLRREAKPVPYLKLHGCLTHRLDRDIPLVLSHEHYHRVSQNRAHLLQRLEHWAYESPIVFIGYQLADAHIRSLVYELDKGTRPQWYIITPRADEHDVQFWRTKNIEILQLGFGDFMLHLTYAIPETARILSSIADGTEPPHRSIYRTRAVESDLTKESLEHDIQFVHAGLPFSDVPPKQFYAGYDDGWCGIIRKYDFPRKTGEDLLYKAVAEDQQGADPVFLLLQGPAGSGKTIALKRAAYDAALALEQVVFWLKEGGVPRTEVIAELYELVGERIFFFVDSVSLYAAEMVTFLRSMRARNIPVTVVAAEREADWTSYCDNLEEEFPPELFHLRNLSGPEVNLLLDLLQRHKCLGLLASMTREEQVDAFMKQDRSDRQLLVALHELTLGKPFEDILYEEYQRIQPAAARRLYLDIASMHQFGSVARAGAISRICSIRFLDFQDRFFLPLKGIVKVGTDGVTGDRSYKTRHPRVAEIVFGRICLADEEKGAQLCRILEGLDTGYSSDKRILTEICRGRALASRFDKIEEARSIFEVAHRACPTEAFLYQQAAILEYSGKGGSLERAQRLALKARELDDRNHIYIHTIAEISRRMATDATSQVRKDQLRSHSRGLLNHIWLKDGRKDLSFCKLLVDETVDLAEELAGEPAPHVALEFDDKLREATERLARAQQEYPQEAEFAETEALLWRRLGETDKAASALGKALRARPRNAGVYVRLAGIQKRAASIDECIETLKQGLERFPDDKRLHLEMGLALLEAKGTSGEDVEYHLRSSYSVGDNSYDSRFYYAEYLFWTGRLDESQGLFNEVDRSAPLTYRTLASRSDDVITARISEYAGVVDARKERFFFIRSGSLLKTVFAHYSSLVDGTYDQLEVGRAVVFKVRFNRKGPVAVSVRTT